MVKLINTKTHYRLIMEKNKNIKVRDVYNSVFFSSFDLDGIRVYSKDNKPMKEEEEEEEDSSRDIIDEDDEDDEDDNKYFFKEKQPSGYSELPLYKKSVVEQDGSIVEKSIEDDKDQGMYDFLNDYISKYTSKQEEVKLEDNEVYLTIPFNVENPVISMNSFSIPDHNEIIMLAKNGLTYNILEKIIQDIYLQIIYLKDKGYYYNEIPLESTFFVNGRYIVFSIETVEKISENDVSHITQPFIKFLNKLLGNDSLDSVLEKIQYTDIYYFIKRAQNENTLLIVK